MREYEFTFYNLDTIFPLFYYWLIVRSYRNFVYEYILFDRALIKRKDRSRVEARVALYVWLEGNAERVSLVAAGQGIDNFSLKFRSSKYAQSTT